jgi:hypothetical protein
MSVTINTLISDALIDLGKLSPSEDIDPNDLTHGLRVANRLFAKWATKNLLIPYTTTESFSGSGSASYTMGTAGTASSVRALRIVDAYCNDGALDYPITIINQQQYNAISNKSYAGRPEVLFYDPLYATGYIYLWRVPSSSYTIYIDSIKYLHTTLTKGATVSLSPEYEDFVVLGLRNRLAGSFGIPVTQYMVKEFVDAENDIKILNLANRSVTMDMPSMFGGSGCGYNIEEG